MSNSLKLKYYLQQKIGFRRSHARLGEIWDNQISLNSDYVTYVWSHYYYQDLNASSATNRVKVWMQLCTINSLFSWYKRDYVFLDNHMYYLECITDLTNVYSFIEHQIAGTYPWKRHIPMKAQLYYKTHEGPRKAATGTLNATTSALCSGPTDRTTNEPEYIFIRYYLFDVSTLLVYSVQHKT